MAGYDDWDEGGLIVHGILCVQDSSKTLVLYIILLIRNIFSLFWFYLDKQTGLVYFKEYSEVSNTTFTNKLLIIVHVNLCYVVSSIRW